MDLINWLIFFVGPNFFKLLTKLKKLFQQLNDDFSTDFQLESSNQFTVILPRIPNRKSASKRKTFPFDKLMMFG